MSWWNFSMESETITSLFHIGFHILFRWMIAFWIYFTICSNMFHKNQSHRVSMISLNLVFQWNGLIHSEIVCFSWYFGRIHFTCLLLHLVGRLELSELFGMLDKYLKLVEKLGINSENQMWWRMKGRFFFYFFFRYV